MDVYFRNESGVGVTILVAFFDPNACIEGPNDERWHLKGWYNLAPGATEYIFSTPNSTFYFYAQDTEGVGKRWTGQDKYAYLVAGIPADQCINIRPPGAEVFGLMEKDGGEVSTYTETLNP